MEIGGTEQRLLKVAVEAMKRALIDANKQRKSRVYRHVCSTSTISP
jgi:hypothetical protein